MDILIVTFAKFPDGDAEAVRLHTIGKLLRNLGHSVTYIGMGFSNYLEKLEYDGLSYTSFRKENKNKLDKWYHFLDFNKRLREYIFSYLNTNKVDIILFADLFPTTINMLKKICKIRDIQLIADSVEWYSPGQFKYGSLSLSMILKNIENRYTIDKNIKVITISNYLYNHFNNKGCVCTKIPVILDVKNIAYEKKNKFDKLTILYAGSPGKKDYVEEMLRGILLLNENELNKLHFELAGVSINDIMSSFTPEELSKLSKCVIFLGRVSRSIVFDKLSVADFTVLLRDADQRYAKAGFPTKVVESLATGTPVILNLTSDLGEYIHHMHEGLIVENCSKFAFAETLKKALHLSVKELEFMRSKARSCAQNNFDYRNYKEKISILIG